jgi:hypothetical protein
MRTSSFLMLLTCAGLVLGSWASNEPGEPLPSPPPPSISELRALLTWVWLRICARMGTQGSQFCRGTLQGPAPCRCMGTGGEGGLDQVASPRSALKERGTAIV